jgi:acyl-CoA reductase-like NAD-dependent aldehyde dehydrogenase
VLRPFRFLTIEKYHKLTRAERKHYVAGVTEELMRRSDELLPDEIAETREAIKTHSHDVSKFAQQVTQLAERAETLHRAIWRLNVR